ncbi:TPM domain-containing protein [Rhodopseudomonas sp. P2A-2r]|uniref:TPM domain-containing protein n=1 Tax=Rhodopseudomonas sp. P2A-2r TaxID=2991972 RepID=UPI002234B4D3|nr:TPM domain-containing protein [Rhodopseudomonas sp. P2A-2r]UZE50828.1 TPM domain-containing protein [Rhodopseudomonas sp. P2A-2r]
MSIARISRHLVANRSRVRKAFPPHALAAIEQAIKASEQGHAGQIRFVVEGALDGAPLFRNQSARARALDVFSNLRIWDTEHNNGVLIYLLLADRDVEIVADRGVHAHVGADGWEAICRAMEADFRAGHFERGVLAGIHAVTQHLVRHFPKRGRGDNELPDAPVVL